MGQLRERLGLHEADYWIPDGEADKQLKEFDRVLEDKTKRSDWIDERDEVLKRNGPSRPSEQTLAAGIRRRAFNLNLSTAEFSERFGFTPEEYKNLLWADTIDDGMQEDVSMAALEAGQLTPEIPTDRERFVNGMHEDLRENFLYREYLEQLFNQHKRPISTSYAVYSFYIAIRAAVLMMAERPNAMELLGVTSTTRDAAVQFNDWLYMNEPDSPHAVIIEAIELIPEVVEVADTLLSSYSTAVRLERQKTRYTDDDPLPDEDEFGLVERDKAKIATAIRMTRAIAAYEGGSKPANEIAREYRVRYSDLLELIRQRGEGSDGLGT